MPLARLVMRQFPCRATWSGRWLARASSPRAGRRRRASRCLPRLLQDPDGGFQPGGAQSRRPDRRARIGHAVDVAAEPLPLGLPEALRADDRRRRQERSGCTTATSSRSRCARSSRGSAPRRRCCCPAPARSATRSRRPACERAGRLDLVPAARRSSDGSDFEQVSLAFDERGELAAMELRDKLGQTTVIEFGARRAAIRRSTRRCSVRAAARRRRDRRAAGALSARCCASRTRRPGRRRACCCSRWCVWGSLHAAAPTCPDRRTSTSSSTSSPTRLLAVWFTGLVPRDALRG